MTAEEAKKHAEMVVYVNYTWPDIIDACERHGIETTTKSGRYRSRRVLEQKLIEVLTAEYQK